MGIKAKTVFALLALLLAQSAHTEDIEALRVKAERGDAEAQYNLGAIYAEGSVVPVDYAEAAKWFRVCSKKAKWYQKRLVQGWTVGRMVAMKMIRIHHTDARAIKRLKKLIQPPAVRSGQISPL